MTERFTPTGVGNAQSYERYIGSSTGSPPRVWGMRQSATCRLRRVAVHPHGCGECKSFQFISGD